MRAKLLGCSLIVVFAAGLVGCTNLVFGGNSHGSGVQSIAVTPGTIGLNQGNIQQFTATATLSNGVVQNYTTIATWSSSDTSKATVVASGTNAGQVTAVGTGGSVTITATSNGVSGTATVTLNPASLDSVTITPGGIGLAVAGTQQFTATANFSNGSQDVTSDPNTTWSSSTSGVANISASGLVTTAAAGQTTISASYAPSGFSAVSGSTALNVVAAPSQIYNNGSFSGDYAFTLTTTGTTTGTPATSVPVYFVGKFHADGAGNISSGVMDGNSPSGMSTNVSLTGTYNIYADGRGNMTLNAKGLPSATYRVILSANQFSTTNPAVQGQFIQFDGKGSAVGSLVLQDTTVFSNAALSGTEVFRATGVDSGFAPLGEAGIFLADGSGNITSGSDDVNDFGVATQDVFGSSTYSIASNGRGTLALSVNGKLSNFVVYVVGSGNIIAMSTDSGEAVLLAHAERQDNTVSYNDALLAPGTGYAFLLETSPAIGRGAFDTVGRVLFDGNGGITTPAGGVQDEAAGGAEILITGGTYTVASNGRTVVSETMADATTRTYIYYLISANRAYILASQNNSAPDTTAAVGTVDIQSHTLTTATFAGNYAMVGVNQSQSQGASALLWMSADGAGNVKGVGDTVVGSSIGSAVLSGTYSVDPNGRTPVVLTAPVGANSYIFYVVTTPEAFMLGVSPSFDGTAFAQ